MPRGWRVAHALLLLHGMATSTSPVRALLLRWFVQYNPLFTLSALCVLGGVFALAGGLGDQGDLALTAILEAYQWLLLGGAALLYRRLARRRSGTILGLLALAYVTDPTLQLAAMTAAGHAWGNVAWVLLLACKLRALAWALQLRVNAGAVVMALAGGATLAVLPVLRVWATGGNAGTWTLWLCGLTAGLGVLWRLSTPQVHSQVPLSEFGQTVLRRMRVVLVVGLVLALLYHGGNAALGVGLSTLWAPLGVALLVTVRANTNGAQLWLRVGVALLLTVLAPRGLGTQHAQVLVMVLAAVALWFNGGGRRWGSAAAVVLAWVALRQEWLLAWPSGVQPVGPVLLASALGVVALWRRRAWNTVLALGVVWAPLVSQQWAMAAPLPPWAVGLGLLCVGFGLLLAGVLLHGVYGWGEKALAMLESVPAAPQADSPAVTSAAAHSLAPDGATPGA